MSKKDELITLISKFVNENTDEVIKEFGSWENALKCVDIKIRKNIKYADEDIIKTLIAFYNEYGNAASEYSYKKAKIKPYPTTIYKRFGSWNKALMKAGIGIKKDISNEELIKVLKEASDSVNGDLTFKKYEKWAKLNNKISAYTIKRKFGGWKNALIQANLK